MDIMLNVHIAESKLYHRSITVAHVLTIAAYQALHVATVENEK